MIFESYLIKRLVNENLTACVNASILVYEQKTAELKAEEIPHFEREKAVVMQPNGSYNISDPFILKTLSAWAKDNEIDVLFTTPLKLLDAFNSRYEQRQKEIFIREGLTKRLKDRLFSYLPTTDTHNGKDTLLDAFVFDNLATDKDKEDTTRHESENAVNRWFDGLSFGESLANKQEKDALCEIDQDAIKDSLFTLVFNAVIRKEQTAPQNATFDKE